jgi:competence protein ComEC
MTRAAPFILITAVFAAGAWLASQFPLPMWFSGLVALGALAALVALILARRQYDQIWVTACVMLLAAGAAWYTFKTTQPDHSPAAYNGRFVVVEGVIDDDEPDRRPDLTYLRVHVGRLVVAGAIVQPDGIVLIRADNSVDWRYGDVVRAFGTLDAPPVFADFDYRDYLARRDVYAWMSRPDPVQRIGADQGSPVLAALLRYKAALRVSAQQIMPAPESALMNGILIGDASELPPGITDAFRRTGTSHIVAISGFNVSIVVGVLVLVLGQFLGRRTVAAIAIPAVLIYMVLVGMSGSVVRAAVMAVIMLFGRFFWRRAFTLNTLFAAAFLMLLFDPRWLFDLSLQLSFAATLGLVLYSDRIHDRVQAWLQHTRCMRRQTARAWAGLLADVLFSTAAATITTMPLLLSTFNQLSLVAFPANALVLPLQPAAMILGIVAVIVGVFYVPAGAVVGLLAYALLTATLRIVEWMGSWPWASAPVYDFGTPHAIAYYMVLGGITAVLSLKSNIRQVLLTLIKRRLGVIGVMVVVILLAALGGVYWFQRPDGSLHVTFTGKGAFIQTPAGRQVVFAGGGGVLPVMGRAMPVWDKSIDLLLLPQRDDYARGDTLPILQRYKPDVIIQPAGEDEPSTMLDEWNRQAGAQSVQVITVPMGTRVELEPDVVLTVGQRLNGAIGARLTYGAVTFELAGDAAVISGTINGADVVFVSVRGAKAPVLNLAHPRMVVWADAGGAPPALDRAIRIRAFTLRDLNTVEFVSDGKTLWTR